MPWAWTASASGARPFGQASTETTQSPRPERTSRREPNQPSSSTNRSTPTLAARRALLLALRTLGHGALTALATVLTIRTVLAFGTFAAFSALGTRLGLRTARTPVAAMLAALATRGLIAPARDQNPKFSVRVMPKRIDGWALSSTIGLSAASPTMRVYFTSPRSEVFSVIL